MTTKLSQLLLSPKHKSAFKRMMIEKDTKERSVINPISQHHQNPPPSPSMMSQSQVRRFVKGEGTYLYSEEGEEYLDCVNSFAHVGHCHPAVVKAATDALSLSKSLNNPAATKAVVDGYVAKLKTILPKELDTFLFVPSGVEANDLAIDLARSYTGRSEIVSVAGNLLNLTRKDAHIIQGPISSSPNENEIKTLTATLANNKKLACFIYEPIMIPSGVVIPSQEWVQSTYRAVHSNQALIIADETQTGLGRCGGSSWWAFEMYPEVPDILIVGETLGNGYPLAVVVTRKEILENSKLIKPQDYQCPLVGGAVGLSVLKIMRDRGLLRATKDVGSFLKEGLKAVGMEHPEYLGEIRGKGLLLGIVVKKNNKKPPAGNLADQICEKLKNDHHIIVGKEGNDVLVITPPLSFTFENAHRVIVGINEVVKSIKEEDEKIQESFHENQNHAELPFRIKRFRNMFDAVD